MKKKKIKASNDCNIDLRYKSLEDIDSIVLDVKLKSMSLALAKQHKCLIDNTSTNKSKICRCFKLI